ncbi:MAG: OsmC family protein [Algicola sp.]|nr:OsmC family protein [Algicola sp.]
MSKRTKVNFPAFNPSGDGQSLQLSGLLESPSQDPRAFVLFAHCFTCGKDVAAASRISRALVVHGYAVLRFDFTGLGNSDGDFANTNFSSNVGDLIAAADYLRTHYRAPSLLIGHSLGGAAVLKAAGKIPESLGIVTIGAPADPDHVIKNFAMDLATIESEGQAKVSLAGRPFTIKKQFVDDLRDNDTSYIGTMKKALLVFHSPLDATVSIEQAEKIYVAAKHPKSFVSLDQADHLLTNKADSEYVATTIAAWAGRYLPNTSANAELVESAVAGGHVIAGGHVTVSERNQVFTQNVYSDSHQWIADEPVSVGGDNLGPDPYEHLLAGLGACTAMTLRMYAERKKLPLEQVTVELSHSRSHGADCQQCDDENPRIEVIDRKVTLVGDLTDAQRQRMLEIADKCPVHKTLHSKLVVDTRLV